jgi:hypothetical protein
VGWKSCVACCETQGYMHRLDRSATIQGMKRISDGNLTDANDPRKLMVVGG